MANRCTAKRVWSSVAERDAHADLRSEFDGTPHSHACAMRRLAEKGATIIAVGIRSGEREEMEFGRRCDNVTTFWAHQLADRGDLARQPRSLIVL